MLEELKKTLVLGASDNPSRYSFLAIHRLRNLGHPVVAIGKRKGFVSDIPIETAQIHFENIHTITIYLNPLHQSAFLDYIFSINPKRIICNPGAENPVLSALALKNGIPLEEACTLVLLSTGQY